MFPNLFKFKVDCFGTLREVRLGRNGIVSKRGHPLPGHSRSGHYLHAGPAKDRAIEKVLRE